MRLATKLLTFAVESLIFSYEKCGNKKNYDTCARNKLLSQELSFLGWSNCLALSCYIASLNFLHLLLLLLLSFFMVFRSCLDSVKPLSIENSTSMKNTKDFIACNLCSVNIFEAVEGFFQYLVFHMCVPLF